MSIALVTIQQGLCDIYALQYGSGYSSWLQTQLRALAPIPPDAGSEIHCEAEPSRMGCYFV